MSTKSDDSRRAPRSFAIDESTAPSKPSSETKTPKQAAAAKAKTTKQSAGSKRPKAFAPVKNFKPTDDEAAQRFTQEQADEVAALTPPAHARSAEAVPLEPSVPRCIGSAHLARHRAVVGTG